MSAPFKVVITDYRFKSIDAARGIVEAAGGTLAAEQCRTDEEVAARCADADALLVTRAPITERAIAALKHCRVIVRFGVGVDVVDIDAASKRGIMVANVPDYCLDEVSDHALTLLLAVARRLPQAIELGRADAWEIGRMPAIPRLRGTVLGLIGMGRIGSRLAEKVKALGIRTIVYDPYLAPEAAARASVEGVPLEALLRQADFVSLHAPLTPETRHILGTAQLALMKPSAIVINTARGELIDQDALRAAITAGKLGGAGLDVLREEPPASGEELLRHPNVIVTAHVAWLSEAARVDLQRKATEQVVAVMQGGEPNGLVNRAALGKR